MKPPYEQATNALSTVDRLDQVCMNPHARRIAKTSLLQAELLADMLMRAYAELSHLSRFVSRGIRASARGSKVSSVTAEWRLS
jgi:hypothetical protein